MFVFRFGGNLQTLILLNYGHDSFGWLAPLSQRLNPWLKSRFTPQLSTVKAAGSLDRPLRLLQRSTYEGYGQAPQIERNVSHNKETYFEEAISKSSGIWGSFPWKLTWFLNFSMGMAAGSSCWDTHHLAV